MTSTPPRPLAAEIDIAAPPAEVWRVVGDARRTGEWSPECRRVVTLGPPRPGRLLLGINRRRAVVWATLSRVTCADAEVELAWTVLTNRSVWTYRLLPVAGGTRLRHTRETPRGEGRFALWFTRAFLGGQRDHDDELERGMASGLDRIRQLVEPAA